MRHLLALLLLGACDPCGPGAPQSLVIGVGETDYSPLDPDDPHWPLVYGPQGGWHIPVAVEGTGLDASEIVVVDMAGTIDGEVLAEVDGTWNQLACDEEAGALQAWNLVLEFTEVQSSCGLDDAEVVVDVAVTDARGETVRATTRGRIDDPIHEEACGD